MRHMGMRLPFLGAMSQAADAVRQAAGSVETASHDARRLSDLTRTLTAQLVGYATGTLDDVGDAARTVRRSAAVVAGCATVVALVAIAVMLDRAGR